MTIEEQLIEEEGARPQAYTDSRGFLTVGVGRLIDPKVPGSGLSRDEALLLLRNDIVGCRNMLDTSLPWWRDIVDARQRVLLSMCFNLGLSGLLKFKEMLGACRMARYSGAAAEMRSSLWYGQVGARAERLALMMERGTDVGMDEARSRFKKERS